MKPISIDDRIDEAFKFIKPVVKVKNGTGIMGMDSARLMLKQAIALEIQKEKISTANVLREAMHHRHREIMKAANIQVYPKNSIPEDDIFDDYLANLQQGNTHE